LDHQFHWTEPDYLSANWAYLKRNWWSFVYGFRLPIGIATASVVVILQNPNSWRDIVGILAVGIGLIAYILITYRWSWRRKFQSFGQGLISATVDGESIRLRGARNVVTMQWLEITDIYESNRVFLFGRSKSRLLFLPKAAMNQPQINELRDLISANAKGKVRLAFLGRLGRKI
jgi:hypothetical protein